MNEEYFIFTKDQVQTFPPNLVFRVYFLEARLSILGRKFGLHNLDPNIVQLNVYHSGVGFQSTDVSKPYEFYLDYLSLQIGIDTFLPKIITLPNGEQTLEWNNHGFVTIGISIDRNYWEQSTYICNITGEKLNQYQQWVLSTFIPRNLFYTYARVIQGLSRNSIYSPLLRSSICDTFCYDSFDYFQNSLTICIDFPTPPFETIVAFIVNSTADITQLNFNDPAQRQFIIDYYKQLTKTIEQSFNYSRQLEQLRQEVNNIADPKQKAIALKSLQLDDQTGRYILAQATQNFPFVILYTYASDNSMQYFKIDFSAVFVNYIESNLKRTLTAINIYGGAVLDEYTQASNNVCSSGGGEASSSCSYSYAITVLLFLIFFINLLFFIVILFYMASR